MTDNVLVSFFAEPRLTVFNHVYLSGGFRLNLSTLYGQVLTPTAGLVYELTPWKLKATYSRGFRAPKPWDYTDGVGNPNLLPERIRSWEAGGSVNLNASMSIDVTAYINTLDNALVKSMVGNSYRWENGGQINVRGVECFYQLHYGALNAALQYTYTNSRFLNNRRVPEISPHTAGGQFSFKLSQQVSTSLRATYLGRRDNFRPFASTGTTAVGPYFILNGTVTAENIAGFMVQLKGINLLNARYYHTSNRSPERYRQAQRTLLVTVSHSLEI